MATPHVVVVGAGISGLTAAWELRRLLPDAAVTVLDASDRPGGKLRRNPVAGTSIDVGAESMLARRPEGLALVEDLGMTESIVHPGTTQAAIWSRGALRPMPRATLMGVPSDPRTFTGLLSTEEVDRAAAEQPWPGGRLRSDVSVAGYVAARLGQAVVDRLVEPLLGGVYAGLASQLSLQAAVPPLWQAATRGESLLAAARRAAEAAAASSTPVFAGLPGGVATLAEQLAESLTGAGVVLRSAAIVRQLHHRPGDSWSLVLGPRPAPELVEADAVVLAVPATPAARLLAPHAARAGALLDGIDYASMAIVSLALDRRGSGRMPAGSGFLVPPVDGRTIKAATFSSAKWPWLLDAAEDVWFLRASVGRSGEEAVLQREDADLVRTAVDEIGAAIGAPLPRVVDAHVQRWGGALPQYAVGHLARIRGIREDVARLPGLELAGAAYEGVGIPACIGTGRAAAGAVATHLRAASPHGGE